MEYRVIKYGRTQPTSFCCAPVQQVGCYLSPALYHADFTASLSNCGDMLMMRKRAAKEISTRALSLSLLLRLSNEQREICKKEIATSVQSSTAL
jgi:hypothetical protein